MLSSPMKNKKRISKLIKANATNLPQYYQNFVIKNFEYNGRESLKTARFNGYNANSSECPQYFKPISKMNIKYDINEQN